MKKLLALLLTAVCTAALLAFAGCTQNTPDPNDKQDGGNKDTVTQIEQEYSICYAFTALNEVSAISADTSVKDYLDVLKEQGKINFDGSDSEYGFYITSVLGIGSKTISSTANSYSGYDWAVYTTVTTIDGVIYSYDDTTFTYDGITLYKAAYGVSGLPCVDGQTYALVYEYSSMTW